MQVSTPKSIPNKIGEGHGSGDLGASYPPGVAALGCRRSIAGAEGEQALPRHKMYDVGEKVRVTIGPGKTCRGLVMCVGSSDDVSARSEENTQTLPAG